MKSYQIKKYIAEFIGTFALVLCGTGSIIINEQNQGSLGILGIAFAFGMIITAMIYVFGNISGAHLNPSVTIAFLIGKLIPKKEAAFYIIAQLIGAILASSLLKFLFPENINLGTTLPSGSISQSLILEIILTYFLMLTILEISSKKKYSTIGGLVLGLVLVGLILVGGPISGGSFNPARSIGPALISQNMTAIWIYLVGPTVGTILALTTWNFVKNKEIN